LYNHATVKEIIVKITFYGAAQTVTGSCHLVELGNKKFLIDCGLFQGPKELRERNYSDFVFDPATIDFLLLTHAHIDHSGRIPQLYKKGFTGKALATPPTVDLCEIMLPDSGHIQEMECERKNKKYLRRGQPLIEPIYTSEEARQCLTHFKRVDYDHLLQIDDNLKICFRNAGHILGSALIELYYEKDGKSAKTVFTGDLGNKNQPIVNDPYIEPELDYLILESTYGNRQHGIRDRVKKRAQLGEAINRALKKGGNIIVPAFAVERTQDFLIDLHILLNDGVIPDFPIYADSPLAISATEIFQRNHQYFDAITKELNLDSGQALTFKNLKFARAVEESKKLNEIKSGIMIISASGMCEAGRIKHHLRNNIYKPEATILFIGYQAVGTLGRRLIDGEKMVRIHGDSYTVKAEIVVLEGFSGHIDQPGIVDWVDAIEKKPAQVILVHGEDDQQEGLRQALQNKFSFPIFIPAWLDEIELLPSQKPAVHAAEKTRQALAQTKKEHLTVYRTVKQNLKELIKIKSNENKLDDLLEDLQTLEKITRKYLR